jgi:hypothetical protein
MLIVMHQKATQDQIDKVVDEIKIEAIKHFPFPEGTGFQSVCCITRAPWTRPFLYPCRVLRRLSRLPVLINR